MPRSASSIENPVASDTRPVATLQNARPPTMTHERRVLSPRRPDRNAAKA